MLIGLFVGMLLALEVAKFGYPHTNAELLSAVRTLKDKGLTLLVSGLIKSDELVAFRTTYSLHPISFA